MLRCLFALGNQLDVELVVPEEGIEVVLVSVEEVQFHDGLVLSTDHALVHIFCEVPEIDVARGASREEEFFLSSENYVGN